MNKLLSVVFVILSLFFTAIDMATAVNVYRSNGMEELGQKIAVARAGATKIVVGKE